MSLVTETPSCFSMLSAFMRERERENIDKKDGLSGTREMAKEST
jgi:hypothetical protein